MMSSKVYLLFDCNVGLILIGLVGRTTGGGEGKRGERDGISSLGVGILAGSATTPFAEAIRRAYSGFILNCAFGSHKPICREREVSITHEDFPAGRSVPYRFLCGLPSRQLRS